MYINAVSAAITVRDNDGSQTTWRCPRIRTETTSCSTTVTHPTPDHHGVDCRPPTGVRLHSVSKLALPARASIAITGRRQSYRVKARGKI